jgi:hypothetical protein
LHIQFLTESSAWDSVVSIETRRGLDISGMKTRRGSNYPHPSRQSLRPPSLLCHGYRVNSGAKREQSDVYHPLPSSSEAKRNYIYNHALPLGLYGLYRARFTLTNIKHSAFHSKGQQLMLFREARPNSYLIREIYGTTGFAV